MSTRRSDADVFYASIIPSNVDDESADVIRQALAGCCGRSSTTTTTSGGGSPSTALAPVLVRRAPAWLQRNRQWQHVVNSDVVSMPDKWEYPWYAAWDLAFHALPLAMVDPEFAKEQLELILRERYVHPNGQIPAYEWNFSDVNPPVHAWATLFTYNTERSITGKRTGSSCGASSTSCSSTSRGG